MTQAHLEGVAALQEGTEEGGGKLGFSGTEICLLWLESKMYLVEMGGVGRR